MNQDKYERLLHDLEELDRQDKQAKTEGFKDRLDKLWKNILPKPATPTQGQELKYNEEE